MAGVAVFFVGALGCNEPKYPVSTDHPLLGRALPALPRRNLVAGGTLEPSELRGRALAVVFFRETCDGCTSTLRAAQAVLMGTHGVLFIGAGEDDDSAATARVVARDHLTFPVLHDEGHVLREALRVMRLPTTFLTDRDGVVRWVAAYELQSDDLIEAVRSEEGAER